MKEKQKGKPKDYDKDLFSISKDKDNFDPEEGVRAATVLPNVLPLPGFLVVVLMDAYYTRTQASCVSQQSRRLERGRLKPVLIQLI
jgi:hypothetical protein